MARRTRLDSELVRRGLARSREHAAELISARRVLVAGVPATKAATQVDATTSVALRAVSGEGADGAPAYASRGGHKLAAALARWKPEGLRITKRRCLDAGASTGGFTDVLLREGAAHVVAVDVGYGQLAWSLRRDARVTVLERTNARDLRPEQVGAPPELVVADVSFISLTLVLPALARCAAPDADYVLLVKPQFEAGREAVGPGGVIRDPAVRAGAVVRVATSAEGLGLGGRGAMPSPLPGPAGNVEYFLWMTAGSPPFDRDRLARTVAAPTAGSAAEVTR